MKRRASSAARRTLAIDVAVEGKRWERIPAARLCARAASAAYAAAPAARKPQQAAELAIVLTSDAAVRRLNKVYRRKDKATDVLSFPAWSLADAPAGHSVLLGDVVIAHGVTARDAQAESKPLADHLMHLVVHGVLHLLGYDHMRDDDARVMERLEISVLKTLGLPDPYETRSAPAAKPSQPKRKRKRTAAARARP